MSRNQGEFIELPSGETLWYVDEDHSYWCHNPKTGKRGRRLTGVTTVVKTLDFDPSRLLAWAAKTQLIGVAELIGPVLLGEVDPENLSWLESPEMIWRELEANELTFDDVRNRAATKGTRVHELALQALAMGRPVPDLDLMSEAERGLAGGVMAFWLDHEPEPEQVEQIVYSERLGVAGRLDFRGKITTCDNLACACKAVEWAEPGVIDLKTGRYLSAAAHSQVGGGYPLLSRESGFGESAWSLILKVTEDGGYELIEAEGTPEGFEAAVAAYREAGRINGATAKAYRAKQKSAVPA